MAVPPPGELGQASVATNNRGKSETIQPERGLSLFREVSSCVTTRNGAKPLAIQFLSMAHKGYGNSTARSRWNGFDLQSRISRKVGLNEGTLQSSVIFGFNFHASAGMMIGTHGAE